MKIPNNYIKEVQKVNPNLNIDMIKKDLVLSYILQELKEEKLDKKVIFKGGTLLAKGILNYHRLSEDLDFTYYKSNFKSNTQKSKEIKKFIKNEFIPFLLKISKKYNFDFKDEMQNESNKYCPVKSSNKLYRFNIYINKEYIKPIKIEIGLVDNLIYDIKSIKIKHLNQSSSNLIFPLKEYTINSYLIKEIILEKIRAIISREVLSERDFFDLYIISKDVDIFDFSIENLKLKLNNAFQKDNFFKNLENINLFNFNSEVKMMNLINYDEKEYENFCYNLVNFLLELKI